MEFDIPPWKALTTAESLVQFAFNSLVRGIGTNVTNKESVAKVETCEVHVNDSFAAKILLEKRRGCLKL